MAPIYAAREKDDGSINSNMLFEKMKRSGKPALVLENFEEISHYLIRNSGKSEKN